MEENTREKEHAEVQTWEERITTLRGLLEEGSGQELAEFLRGQEPEDIADVLAEFEVEEKLRIFTLLESEEAAVVLDDTDPQTRLQILQKVDDAKLAQILDAMPVDEAADIVEEIPEDERESILELMEEKDVEEVEEILSYPKDSAARVMNPEFVHVSEENDIEDAIRYIRSLEVDEDIFYVYVIDKDMKLKGIVPIRKLLTARKGALIKDIMEEDVHSAIVDEDQERVAQIMKKYDLTALPVVDSKGVLVGRVTIDDILDVVDEEHGEDISRMTGTIEEEQGTESTVQATQNRLPWLVTCMLGSIVTGLVIQFFEVTLAEMIALVSFIPVITATGGNSGVQASTVVVREIALDRMDFPRVWEEIWRQLKIALILGAVCAMILSVLANYWKGNSVVGIIVGLSIFLVVVWSNFVGVLIPVVFKKIGVDPAIASGPLITTLNDVIGVFIYLSVATTFLG
ncbi:MAG: magnesium transporter [Candidatus Omnitrophica bacterium]|nr:magnesium transporter [Candidatus Omnitrophota bacterium]